MKQFIKDIILNYRIRRAIKLAEELSKVSKRKYLVLQVAGVPKVYSKQELKKMIAGRKFRKGTTIQDLEKRAIVITGPEATEVTHETADLAIYRGNSRTVKRLL
jgi:hypothetical protein